MYGGANFPITRRSDKMKTMASSILLVCLLCGVVEAQAKKRAPKSKPGISLKLPLKIGMGGTLEALSIKVLDITDEKHVILSVKQYGTNQYASDNRVIYKTEETGSAKVSAVLDTTDLVTDQLFTDKRKFKVTGTVKTDYGKLFVIEPDKK